MTARSRTLATTLVLLAAAGGAVALAWFGVLKKDEQRDAEERLYRFSPADVQAVTVEAKGERTRLVRAGDGWRLEEPVHADAERAAVTSLVERVAELRRKAVVADAPDPTALARYGLAKPRAQVSLLLGGGRTETLALGDENPFDGTAFVRGTAGAVALVAGGLERTVERSAFDLREKRLFPFGEQDVREVEVRTPRLAYALSRETGAWRLAEPAAEPADPAAAARVLAALRGLRATAFVDRAQDDRELGLDRPRWKVTVATAKGVRTVEMGEVPAPASGDPGASSRAVYARVAGMPEVAAVPEGPLRDLDQDLASLRARPEPKGADGGSARRGGAFPEPGPQPGAASPASAVDPERRRP